MAKVKVVDIQAAGFYADNNVHGSTDKIVLKRGNEYVSCNGVLYFEVDELEEMFEQWAECAADGEEGYKYWIAAPKGKVKLKQNVWLTPAEVRQKLGDWVFDEMDLPKSEHDAEALKRHVALANTKLEQRGIAYRATACKLHKSGIYFEWMFAAA